MKKYLLFSLILLSGCVTLPAPVTTCQDKETDPPTAIGYNEHYAHQMRDGSIYWFVQTRAYLNCLTVTKEQKSLTEDEWKASLKDYHYEVLTNSTQENK